MYKILVFLFSFMAFSSVQAFDRIEKKCLDEGYVIVAENCGEKSVPVDVCPHHERYFKSCSQSAWCEKEGYVYSSENCKTPSFVADECPNKFPLYKECKEDLRKACVDTGYKHKDECQLSDVRCPYSSDYGYCCTGCEDFPVALEDLPRGYVQDGDACYTCEGKVRVKIKPNPCEGFLECPLGPDSVDTPSCLSADKLLYKSCQNSEIKCHADGFTQTSCLDYEDVSLCPHDNSYMSCSLNCDKLAKITYPTANFVREDVVNPDFNSDFGEIRSYMMLEKEECRPAKKPVVTLNLTPDNISKYKNVFNHYINDVDFKVVMQNRENMEFNGTLSNVSIVFSGVLPSCIFENGHADLYGEIKIKGATKICNDFSLGEGASLNLAANLDGDIRAEENASVVITRNVKGLVNIGKNGNLKINGKLVAEDLLNSDVNKGSVILGCNTKADIKQGIELNTANLLLKDDAYLETPQIILISKSDMLTLPNSLSAVHLYKGSKIIHNLDVNNQLDIAMNDEEDCDDKYLVYFGSSFDDKKQRFSLQADDTLQGQWQCQKLEEKDKTCD